MSVNTLKARSEMLDRSRSFLESVGKPNQNQQTLENKQSEVPQGVDNSQIEIMQLNSDLYMGVMMLFPQIVMSYTRWRSGSIIMAAVLVALSVFLTSSYSLLNNIVTTAVIIMIGSLVATIDYYKNWEPAMSLLRALQTRAKKYASNQS